MVARSPLFAFAAALAATLAACGPKVPLEVLEPAAVNVPQAIRSIGVVDRSKAKDAGQGVLGVLEGAVTGEAIGADTDGRASAVQNVVTTLRTSPRYDEITVISVDAKTAGSSLFDTDLDWATAGKLAADAGVDAIVALEAFDSDSLLDVDSRTSEETVDGKTVKTTTWTAERQTSVLTSWQMYHPAEKRVVDVWRESRTAQTWTESGATRNGAVAKLPDQRETVIVVGGLAGDGYARRIAPAYVTVVRGYYAKGHDALEDAKARVKAGDWAGAAQLWEPLVASTDRKERGRARFNLALQAEVAGDLDAAVEIARAAAVDLDNGKARDYLATLEQRRADALRLQEQLGE